MTCRPQLVSVGSRLVQVQTWHGTTNLGNLIEIDLCETYHFPGTRERKSTASAIKLRRFSIEFRRYPSFFTKFTISIAKPSNSARERKLQEDAATSLVTGWWTKNVYDPQHETCFSMTHTPVMASVKTGRRSPSLHSPQSFPKWFCSGVKPDSDICKQCLKNVHSLTSGD